MRKERKDIQIGKLALNEGQLHWLPKNPRTWTREDMDRTRNSLIEDPDFLEERPLLVVPLDKATFVAFCGNLRLSAAQSAKDFKTLPCVVHYPETDADRDAILRRAMKDNGSFGKTDWDEVFSSEWGNMPLKEWGLTPPSWEEAPSDLGLSTKGREGEEGYKEFVEKFQQKVTTDDCYTPHAVYDAVLDFVRTITNLEGRKVERPFVPGGDFENYKYTQRSIVVDNPPFSILSKIIRFYCGRNIPFFLFAPGLTLFSATDCDLTYIVADCSITYENGAVVRTGFITNLIPDLRIWVCPELGEAVVNAQENEDKTKKGFVYPDNIVTSAILQKIASHGVELKVRKVSCQPIKQSDSAEEQGRALYGGGFIMSDGAAAERAAAERAAAERAAAERAAATRLNLSPREKAIIQHLNEQDGTTTINSEETAE